MLKRGVSWLSGGSDLQASELCLVRTSFEGDRMMPDKMHLHG